MPSASISEIVSMLRARSTERPGSLVALRSKLGLCAGSERPGALEALSRGGALSAAPTEEELALAALVILVERAP